MTMHRSSALLAVLLGVLAAGPVRAEPDGETAARLARLAVVRRDAARKTYQTQWTDYRERRASLDSLYRWSVRWLEAERRLSDRQADVVAAFRDHWDRMRDVERLMRRLAGTGQTTIDEVSAAEFYRAEAEVWYLQAKDDKKDR
jgi:hypothetical protein